jgi:hypothetical protein
MGEDELVSAANIRVCSVAWLHASGLQVARGQRIM